MECPYCKVQNRDGVRYCGSCGKLISPDAPVTSPTRLGDSGSIPRSLTPGSRLQGGRYLIKAVLGQGGMGAALLAQDLRLDSKPVVIKELISDHTDPQRNQEDVRNFKREVSTLAHIDHPLVPNVTDHFQEGSRYFMVQEYVEGENLEERLEHTRQPMQEREVLLCASEVLDILDYLSQQTPPIVHRDIKPANIVIGSKDKRAHLVDFGIARADEARNAQRKQTAALGTPGYAPPEQYQGNADPRSDLYALAATLHHVLTNRDPRNYPPFAYPRARSLNALLSPDIERVLTSELTNDVNQRYQSAAAMKREIDGILQQHFGVVGNINSYMLGSSGAMHAFSNPGTSNAGIQAPPSNPNQLPIAPWSMQTAQPTLAGPPTAPTYVVSSPPVVPPPNYYQPLSMYNTPPSPQGKQRRRLWVFILLLMLVAIILGSTFAVLSFSRAHTNPPGNGSGPATKGVTTGNGIGVTLVGNEYIGVSDGTFAFDTNRAGGKFEQQAAAHLKQNSNDPGAAIALLDEAIAQDSNDAEALIYLEDLRVVGSGEPYVTFVVATMLTGGSTLSGVGEDNLQGAYVAQKEYNDNSMLHGGVKVRLLVANSGSQTASANQVAQQIVQLSKSDATFVGVMGWPYSSRTVAVIKTFSQASIPLVSPTSSSDALTGSSPYFFRVAPANTIQGIVGARYAEHNLHATTAALFMDPADPYSQSLAHDFAQQFQSDHEKIVVTEDYTKGQASTITAHIADAMSYHPDVIYFSGYASDVSTLLASQESGTIPVMGGDALYELSGYSSQVGHVNFSRLRFTTFAYPDEWDILGYKPKPVFFVDFAHYFDPAQRHQGSPYGFTRADNDAILSYDAMTALLQGCNNALNAGKSKPTSGDLQQGLRQITGTNGFQGVSGQIAFGPDGDPVGKAIVILDVSPQGHIQMEPMGSDQGRFLK